MGPVIGMRTHTLLGAAAGLLLSISGAWAQAVAPAPTPSGPPAAAVRRVAPQLYFLKLQGLVHDRIVDPKASRYDLETILQVVLDADGAIVKHAVIKATGLPIYELAVRKGLAEFAPTGKARLPVATDPDIKAQAMGAGVMVRIRFQGTERRPKQRLLQPKPMPTKRPPTRAVLPKQKER